MAYGITLSLLASAAQSASGTGASVDLVVTEVPYRFARLDLTVTAVTGTLAVFIETSKGGTVWRQVATQASITGPIESEILAYGLDSHVRVRWTLTGAGAAATFGIGGVAYQVYAAPSDLYAHASPAALYANTPVTEPVIAGDLSVATGTAEGYLSAAGYSLPLKSWGTDLVQAVTWIADYSLVTTKGISPEGESYTIFKDRRDAAVKWLRDVAARNVVPQGIVDSADPVTVATGGRAVVATSPQRGW